jgi:hypothetical protein
MKRFLLSVLAVTLAATLSCDSGPTAGELDIHLTTPTNDDGAIRFVVTAQSPHVLEEVSAACVGCEVFTRKLSDTEIRVILFGSLATGIVARVMVSNTRAPSGYTLTLQEVAGADLGIYSTSTRRLEFGPATH